MDAGGSGIPKRPKKKDGTDATMSKSASSPTIFVTDPSRVPNFRRVSDVGLMHITDLISERTRQRRTQLLTKIPLPQLPVPMDVDGSGRMSMSDVMTMLEHLDAQVYEGERQFPHFGSSDHEENMMIQLQVASVWMESLSKQPAVLRDQAMALALDKVNRALGFLREEIPAAIKEWDFKTQVGFENEQNSLLDFATAAVVECRAYEAKVQGFKREAERLKRQSAEQRTEIEALHLKMAVLEEEVNKFASVKHFLERTDDDTYSELKALLFP